MNGNIYINGRSKFFEVATLSKTEILESFLGVSSCMFSLEDYEVNVSKTSVKSGISFLMRHLNSAKDFSFSIEPDHVYKITVRLKEDS